MARKNVLPYQLLTNQSLAVPFTTIPTVVTFTDNIGYQIDITTSNSTGTFEVEISNNYAVNNVTNTVENPGTWEPLTLGGPTANPIVSAANDIISISLNQLPFGAIRLRYIPSVAGTGTCSVWFLSKQIGG